MKETTDDETELVSPPRAVSTWGDNSPFMMSNPSPPRNILQGSEPPLIISEADQVEVKRIADGFLSEVSTPDCGSKNGQDCLSSAESKKQYYNADKLSPQKTLPASCNELDCEDESKTDGSTMPISNGRMEGVSRDSCRSPETSASGRTSKEEKEHISFVKPDAPLVKETGRQGDGQLNATTALKRKDILGNEEKIQRKRLKTGTSDRTRGKGSAQGSHLSEEELKKLRRVKNRESVEKCRTKQRLRMEALQVEQTCLRLENKNIREGMTLMHAAVREVSIQVTKIKAREPKHVDEEAGGNMKEMRKEVQA